MTKQFTVSLPGIDFWGQTPGTSSMKFQVNCLAAAAFAFFAISFFFVVWDPNAKPECKAEAGTQT